MLNTTLTPYTLAPNVLLDAEEINLVGQPTIAVTGDLADLDNVSDSAPSDGQPLVYNAGTSKWEPGTPSSIYFGGVVPGLSQDLRGWAYKASVGGANKTAQWDADAIVLQQVDGLAWASPTRHLAVYPSAVMTLDMSTTGLGGLDAGTVAVGWYYVWCISNGTTVGVLASLGKSIGNITLPSGYEWATRISAIYVASVTGPALRDFQQTGNRIWTEPVIVLSGATGTTLYNGSAGMVLSSGALTSFKTAVPETVRSCFGVMGTTSAADCRAVVRAAKQDGTALVDIISNNYLSIGKAAGTIGGFYAAGPWEVAIPGGTQAGLGYDRNLWVYAESGAETYNLYVNGFTI